jgi:hypothetical protein
MRTLFVSVIFMVMPGAAAAQNGDAAAAALATLVQDIFGPRGLTVHSNALLPDGSTHSAHFNSAFQSNFRQFNIALASQLTSVPLPSPASGFTYRFDTATGTFARSTQSFGPILADRAETIGQGKIVFGYNYQFFSFDALEGVDMRRIPALFTHDDFQLGGGRADVVVTTNAIEASVAQFTGLVTYGIRDRTELSVAVPVVHTRLAVASDAVIRRLGTAPGTAVHYFPEPTAPGGIGDHQLFAAQGSATGVGDLVVRAKHTLVRKGHRGIAAGVEVRMPSGDEDDLLGSGAWGVRPFAVVSFAYGRFSPHANIGYQWNGSSVLAGDPRRGNKADLPDRVTTAVGADVGLSDRMTIAFDLLTNLVMRSPRLRMHQFTVEGPLGSAVFDDIGFTEETYVTGNGSIGLKLNVAAGMLVNFNLRFNATSGGLTDRLVPLLGLEYGF